MLAMMGLAGTAAGLGLAVVRSRLDRMAAARASKEATVEQEFNDSESPRSTDSTDSGLS